MSEKILIYHYTKRENLNAIFMQGLIPGTKFLTLGSKLREAANYFWDSPESDSMGYAGNSNFECLEISIEPKLCMVASMDMISAAFVNFMMAKKNEALHDYRELAKLYDSSALSYLSYEAGRFRMPEIIVQGTISPKDIRVAGSTVNKMQFLNNRQIYNDDLKKAMQFEAEDNVFSDIKAVISFLENAGKMKKVALHDDSTGLLHSYLLGDKFVTLDADVS